MSAERSGRATYELMLEGRLGPVLRKALQNSMVARTGVSTVIRTSSTDERDLVDLVRQLDARGLTIQNIGRVRRRRTR
jgi:hypothetical protein